VTLTPTNIVQSNEYYPFGLQTANSWTRDNTTNNFLYDAGSELNNSTGMYDLPYRNYDASLGRFFQVDPLATTSHTFTPYHYAGNNPIGANDPSGLVKQYYANFWDDPLWQYTVWPMIAPKTVGAAFDAIDAVASGWTVDAGGGSGGGGSGGMGGGAGTIVIDFNNLPENSQTTIFFDNGEPVMVMQTAEYNIPSPGNGAVSNSDDAFGHGPNAQGYLTQGGITADEARAYAAKAFGWSPGDINIRFDKPEGYEYQVEKNGQVTFSGARGVTDWSRDANGTVIDGKVDIFLSPSALDSYPQLFLTLGHEMVHANDRLSFGFDNFSSGASEYNAYSWSIAAARGLGPAWSVVVAGNQTKRAMYTQNPAYNYNVTTTYIRP
jgi:RHS repeat-associated protein